MYTVISTFSSKCHLRLGPRTLQPPDAFITNFLLLIAFLLQNVPAYAE